MTSHGTVIELFGLNKKRNTMKKLLYSLLITGVVIVVSTNSSYSQQVKESTKAELDLTKAEMVRAEMRITPKRVHNTTMHQVKYKDAKRVRPITRKAKVKTLPARVEIKRDK